MSSRREEASWARESSDLSEVEGIGAVDMLRALGAAGRKHPTALLVWRLIDQGDKSVFRKAFDGLLVECVRLKIESDPIHVVSNVLQYLVDPKCRHCRGRCFELAEGAARLSDRPCSECGGTGNRTSGWGDQEHRLNDWLQAQQALAAAAVTRKLRE
jgi:hypothetical protein